MINNNLAEQSILGAILKDGTLIDTLILEATHFGNASHQVIFNAMSELKEKGIIIDIVTLVTELGEDLESVGNTGYLAGLSESFTTFESVGFHQELILQKFQERRFKAISLKNAEDSNYENIGQTIKDLENIMNVISNEEEITYQEQLKELAYEMGSVKDLSELGYKTGFDSYDRLTGGLQKSNLIVVGARPSVGKTAFGLNFGAKHCEAGGTTHIFSLEMDTKSIVKRLINMTGKIKSTAWQSASFSATDYDKGMLAIDIMLKWDMNIYENVRSASGIRATMRKVMKEQPDKRHLVVIDHLGEFEKRSGFDRNDLEVGDNAHQCRNMSKEHDIPVVLLSQLGRGVEQRQDKRPTMADLRDSGEIEQYADVVALLYRDDYYNMEEQTNIIEIIIGKQRDGPQGTAELFFEKEFGRFGNLDYKYTRGQ